MIISVEIMINEQKLIKSDNFTRVNNLSILLVLGTLNLTILSSLILVFRASFPVYNQTLFGYHLNSCIILTDFLNRPEPYRLGETN